MERPKGKISTIRVCKGMWNERGKTRDTYKHHRRGYTSPGLFDTLCFYLLSVSLRYLLAFSPEGKTEEKRRSPEEGSQGQPEERPERP